MVVCAERQALSMRIAQEPPRLEGAAVDVYGLVGDAAEVQRKSRGRGWQVLVLRDEVVGEGGQLYGAAAGRGRGIQAGQQQVLAEVLETCGVGERAADDLGPVHALRVGECRFEGSAQDGKGAA